jgi:hypothetical protein
LRHKHPRVSFLSLANSLKQAGGEDE